MIVERAMIVYAVKFTLISKGKKSKDRKGEVVCSFFLHTRKASNPGGFRDWSRPTSTLLEPCRKLLAQIWILKGQDKDHTIKRGPWWEKTTRPFSELCQISGTVCGFLI
jgi:hypothetical protein